jgi:UDP-N-acetylglucosamine--N-acetylmuramyl-(pentapeptide) pyrophosphoryl-undecaprenol N-acetylglucosamine transferase
MSAGTVKILVMAGGTGGHVFPALAVARELLARNCEIAWLGTRKGIEARLVPAAQIPLHFLEIGGLRGKGWRSMASAPWQILSAVGAAMRLLKELRPQMVLGMGGYASGPGGVAARILGIPLVVHEQNARAGTTNKWLAKIATRVLTAFPQVLPRSEWVGNPVRDEIAALPEPQARLQGRTGPMHLLVLGGSLGARALNEIMPAAAVQLPKNAVQIRHQTGESHLAATQALYQHNAVAAEVVAFIQDMAEALAWADLVVCRAGALTVAELSAAGVAAILIPFPHAIDDHQTANGNWLVACGAAELRQQNALSAQQLQELLMTFIQQPERRLRMAQAARTVAKPEATRLCADICLEVALGQR